MEKIIDRFLRYVAYDTQSSDVSDTFPSTLKQLALADLLADELHALGLVDARRDPYGYVYATLPANTAGAHAPAIGLIAHMDTATEISGANIKARVIPYAGGDIVLNEDKKIVMSAKEFTSLAQKVGEELVVTDGTTLLGADDKAGIAEIMGAVEALILHPEIPHGKICIAFTPDEEVGGGTDHFDVAAFGADYAYTLDGGEVGQINCENFNACTATLDVRGISIHPGSAKDKMKNAALLAMEFHTMLPSHQIPATTQNYEGFFHLTHMRGEVENAQLQYLIRDHDRASFELRKQKMLDIVAYLNHLHGQDTFVLTLRDTYYNMLEKLQDRPEILDGVKAAMIRLGITPHLSPIRGGTDGSRLSFMGLPCPNLCTGGHNAHGRFEYVSVQSMQICARIIVETIKIAAEK